MKLIFLFCLMFLSNLGLSQIDTIDLKIFATNELKEDFTFWRNRIEHKHPLAYLYTSKKRLDRCFDSLYQQIDRPMTEIDFIKLLTPVTAIIQDGHNYVIPSKSTLDSLRNYKYLFPLYLKFIHEKLYVVQDLSASKVPLTGLEITSINNIYSKDMLHVFLSNVGRDGNNYQHAYAAINESFRFYFHLFFGFTKEFSITYRTKNNRDSTCIIKGSSLAAMEEERLNRYPTIAKNDNKSGLKLNIIDSIHAAVVSIKTFSPKTSNRKFKKEISGYFESLRKSNTLNLILDLRDNGGGNPKLVKVILQYLFDKPFEQAKECRIVQNSGKDTFLERTRKKWYPWYGIGSFNPKKNNFKGSLYVLVNEGTFSAGVTFSSVLRKYNRAVFIGDETGGNPIVMAGYLIKTSWKLPNTKIQVGSGNLCTIYDELNLNQGRGLLPNYMVKMEPEDILSSKDRYLNCAIKLIKDHHPSNSINPPPP